MSSKKEKEMANRPKCCGVPMNTPLELGIPLDKLFCDEGWAWRGEDIAYVCSVCGAQILKKDL